MSDPEPRLLGVIESFVTVRDKCPNGSVRTAAERALETVKGAPSGVLEEQAFLVLSALRGWRGDAASQVRRSLEHFLAQSKRSN